MPINENTVPQDIMAENQEPIMEFKDLEQAYKCLKYWQSKLFLNDWLIQIKLIPLSEMDDQNHLAENHYQAILNCSTIKMGLFTDAIRNSEFFKESHELTLIHELLHLKFIMTDGVKETMEGHFIGAYEHQLIEQMAKSLFMAKYNLNYDWFKNF